MLSLLYADLIWYTIW